MTSRCRLAHRQSSCPPAADRGLAPEGLAHAHAKGPSGRRRRWAARRALAAESPQDESPVKQEDDWNELNVFLFGPREQYSEPREPAGLGIGPRWFDRCLSLVFDADEGSLDRSVLGVDGYTEDHGEWTRISAVMDSGACAPVAPPDMLPEFPILPNAASRAGVSFSAANGDPIKRHGEQRVEVVTDNGVPTEILFQLCDVTRPLVSISHICDKGNRVIYGRSGGIILNLETGAEVPFYRHGAVYSVGLWVRRAPNSAAVPQAVAGSAAQAPFVRR